MGLTCLIGIHRTVLFFSRKEKIAGTAFFFVGILLVILRWPLIGMLLESIGISNLFGLVSFTQQIPSDNLAVGSQGEFASPSKSAATRGLALSFDMTNVRAAASSCRSLAGIRSFLQQ